MAGFLLASLSSPAWGQEVQRTTGPAWELVHGRIVRITSAELQCNRLMVRVVSVDADTVVLERERRRVPVPRASVDFVEVRTGRHRHVVEGAAIGGAVGLVAVIAAGAAHTSSSGFLETDELAVDMVQVGAIPAGILVGGVLGALVTHETWTFLPDLGRVPDR